MKTLRVMLADDHALFRAGLRTLLRQRPDIEIVGEAANGRLAVELAQQTRPDVVIMDISMKELNGLDATLQIKAQVPNTRVIIISMHDSEEFVAQALRAGASAYLLKDSTEAELDPALAAVSRGETYLTPRVATQLVGGYLRGATPSSTFDALTARQRELLQLIAEGHSTKEIAYRLTLSVKTVENHRAQIMDRLKIRDVPGLVRYAIRNGLVSPDK